MKNNLHISPYIFPMLAKPSQPSPYDVIKRASVFFNIKEADIRNKCRKVEWVAIRHMVMFFFHNQCGYNFRQCAEIFGHKDHTTAMHAIDRLKGAWRYEVKLWEVYLEFVAALRGTDVYKGSISHAVRTKEEEE